MSNKKTDIEKLVRKLVAINNIKIPLSSMYQKEKRIEQNYAQGIANELAENTNIGKSVTAYIDIEKSQKARGIREGIEIFSKKYPRYGKILQGIIEEKREEREKYLKYGLNPGYALSNREYMSVMRDLDMTDEEAEIMLPNLLSISERLQKKRKEGLRSILID